VRIFKDSGNIFFDSINGIGTAAATPIIVSNTLIALSSTNGDSTFPSSLRVEIAAFDATDFTSPLQEFKLHISCSRDLILGEIYGSLKLIKFVNDDGIQEIIVGTPISIKTQTGQKIDRFDRSEFGIPVSFGGCITIRSDDCDEGFGQFWTCQNSENGGGPPGPRGPTGATGATGTCDCDDHDNEKCYTFFNGYDTFAAANAPNTRHVIKARNNKVTKDAPSDASWTSVPELINDNTVTPNDTYSELEFCDNTNYTCAIAGAGYPQYLIKIKHTANPNNVTNIIIDISKKINKNANLELCIWNNRTTTWNLVFNTPHTTGNDRRDIRCLEVIQGSDYVDVNKDIYLILQAPVINTELDLDCVIVCVCSNTYWHRICENFDQFRSGATNEDTLMISGINLTLSDATQINGKNRLLMIFDTENPAAGDVDLGTPNEDFDIFGNSISNPNGPLGVIGPGIGSGGSEGAAGENRLPIGNALIISQDNNRSTPNDWFPPGPTYPKITFEFDQIVYIDNLDLLDADQGGQISATIKFFDINDNQLGSDINAQDLGSNGYQILDLNQNNVKKMVITVRDSLAIPKFCYRVKRVHGSGTLLC